MGIQIERVIICEYLAYLVSYFIVKPGLFQYLSKPKNFTWIFPLITAIGSYLLYGNWNYWQLPVFIFFIYLIIDLTIDPVRKMSTGWFCLRQVVLFIATIIVPVLFAPGGSTWMQIVGEGYFGVLVILAGWLFAGLLCGDGIGKYLDSLGAPDTSGINNGGQVIGFLERSIIFVLLLLNAATGIGFLMTAKTLFRFGEISRSGANRKQVEYILIGTMLSFFVGALVSVLSMYLSMQLCPGWKFNLLG
jgi:hypothetical protein